MVINTPDWVKHAIFYEIFPDRFARSQRNLDYLSSSAVLEDWNSPPTTYGYKGGNLYGIIERLDYLQDLGINAIYLTPIFQSASNHRYHPHDYYQIDSLLGGNSAFNNLLNAAHQRNIKVILDCVFNHASRGFIFFNDILENGESSPWLNWFRIQDWPLFPYDNENSSNYLCWQNIKALPQFNHDNPAVREYLMKIGEYWIQHGIDGWRLDVPDCIKVSGFWQEFRQRIKAINPDAYIVGEIMDYATEWLDGSQFDGVMNYPFKTSTLLFTAGENILSEYLQQKDGNPFPLLDAEGYADKIQHLLSLYPWEIQLTQLNLLASHDIPRPLTTVGGDYSSIELANLLLFTFPGAPCIYYGDEVGLSGGYDPNCRRTFPLEIEWNQEMLSYHRKLIAIRQSYPALRIGDYQVLVAKKAIFIFTRCLEKEELIIAINTSKQLIEIECEASGVSFKDGNCYTLQSSPDQILYGSGNIQWVCQESINKFILTIPSRSGLIISN